MSVEIIKYGLNNSVDEIMDKIPDRIRLSIKNHKNRIDELQKENESIKILHDSIRHGYDDLRIKNKRLQIEQHYLKNRLFRAAQWFDEYAQSNKLKGKSEKAKSNIKKANYLKQPYKSKIIKCKTK